VVEFARDEEQRRVTRLQDPVGKVTQYRVEDGWRVLAADASRCVMVSGIGAVSAADDTAPVHPEPGNIVTLPDGRSGVILQARGMGKLIQLQVRFSEDQVESLLYRPDQMTLRPAGEG
jgi:hypothetical protein